MGRRNKKPSTLIPEEPGEDIEIELETDPEENSEDELTDAQYRKQCRAGGHSFPDCEASLAELRKRQTQNEILKKRLRHEKWMSFFKSGQGFTLFACSLLILGLVGYFVYYAITTMRSLDIDFMELLQMMFSGGG